ncbi:SagB/ThcOx family dehydrogenase [Elusimicrobiota bacterium]
MRIFALSVFIAVSLYSAQDQRPGDNIAKMFHEKTKYILKKHSVAFPAAKKPKLERTALPKPVFKGISVEDAIAKRRSVRNYSDKEMSLAELSQLLFAGHGITGDVKAYNLKSVPSAGALYPFEIYLVVNRVKGLSKGLYRYIEEDHSLEFLREGDFSKAAKQASMGQNMLEDSCVVFALAAVFSRTCSKYADRGMRYVYMEAGHISQNIYIESASLGLGTVAIGAFYDNAWNKMFGLDGEKEAVVYLQTVGKI